nr:HTH-type transcriptional repressor NicS [Paraburkholderia busanensis]
MVQRGIRTLSAMTARLQSTPMPANASREPFTVSPATRAETVMSSTAVRKPGATGIRAKQAQDTRAKILKAAIKVFAKQGYASGRVESISKAARSHDRMIYYYFGSKEQLFVEVLETIYTQFNEAESRLDLDVDNPIHGLEQMVEFVWQYYLDHPEFVTLLSSENLHQGKHAKKSLKLKEISGYAISVVQRLLDAGIAQNVFRADVKARDVYLMIASLGYFYNANQYTLGAFLGEPLMDKAALAHWREVIKDTVLRAVRLQLPPMPPMPSSLPESSVSPVSPASPASASDVQDAASSSRNSLSAR